MFSYIRRNRVKRSTTGTRNRYAIVITNPSHSRTSQWYRNGSGLLSAVGRARPMIQFHQTLLMSTLFSASCLCESQNSYGPKKLQLGPRKNVPKKISTTHKIKNPNSHVAIAKGRSLSV